jgi:hypothetical protein
VTDLTRLAGMSAIAVNDEMARSSRDLQALAAHSSVSPRHWQLCGQTLLA